MTEGFPRRAVTSEPGRIRDRCRRRRTLAEPFATLMTLIAVGLAGLIAAWRYFPDRLPPQLRAENVLNIHASAPPPPPAPVRPPAPPESQFDE